MKQSPNRSARARRKASEEGRGPDIAIRGGHELNAPPWTRVEGTLMATARSVRRAYDKRLSEAGVHLGEASILAHLADAGSLTQVDLANRIGTGRANVGVLIDGLEGKGLVRRKSDPDDRRVWRVDLTEDGQHTWEHTVEIDRAMRHQLRAGTTPAERDQLDSLLARINANVQVILNDR